MEQGSHQTFQCTPADAGDASARGCQLEQEEADPGPARVALAAPAHAVLSHGRVRRARRLGVAAAAARRLLVARAAPRARRRQPREVQLVLHENTRVTTAPHSSREALRLDNKTLMRRCSIGIII